MSRLRIPQPELEDLVLACIIADARNLDQLEIAESDFVVDENQRIWNILHAMHKSGESLRDQTRIVLHCREAGIVEAVGGLVEFNRRFIDFGLAHNQQFYVAELQRQSLRRKIKAVCQGILTTLEDAEEPAEILSEAIAELTNLQSECSETQAVETLYEASKKRVDALENPKSKEVRSLIASGVQCLDQAYGGFRRGGSYIVAARPGRGKSALMKQILNQLDLRGISCLAISLEMEPDEFAARVLSERAEVDGKFLEIDESGECPVTTDELERLRDALANMSNTQLRISAPTGKRAQLDSILGLVRLAKVKWQIQAFAIDYLQLIPKSNPKISDYEHVTDASKKLKLLARELGVVAITLAQLNRESDKGNKPRRPRLSDLKDSGSIEQDADAVIFLHQPVERQAEYELIVPKWRNDAEGMWNVRLVGRFTKFEPQQQSSTGDKGDWDSWEVSEDGNDD